jgi:hypothetical protein
VETFLVVTNNFLCSTIWYIAYVLQIQNLIFSFISWGHLSVLRGSGVPSKQLSLFYMGQKGARIGVLTKITLPSSKCTAFSDSKLELLVTYF